MGLALDRRIRLVRPREPGTEAVLSHEALAFVARLESEFGPRRRQILGERTRRQARYDSGDRPGYDEETWTIRERDWKVAPVPHDLEDRRVEIVGPTERRTMIEALNSGAQVYLADFEDTHSPTFAVTVQGQQNLYDAVRGTLETTGEAGELLGLGARIATLMVRPRGWHMLESGLEVDDHPVSAALFDFGMHLYHNADELLARGSGPYFSLAKIESWHEARLWRDVFVAAEDQLGLPRGTIRATVLIETLPAVFQVHEILWELREHSAGLHCGQWDYVFSTIKKLRAHNRCLLPDRARISANATFLRACSRAVVQACHRRGVHALGGTANHLPDRKDAAQNAKILARVRADTIRDLRAGFDGTWVSHPGLVPVVREIVESRLTTPHQIHVLHEGEPVRAEELLDTPTGSITPGGVWTNVELALCCLEAWLRGVGRLAVEGRLEDISAAEVSRAQLWQWIRHPDARLSDGSHLTVESFRETLEEVLDFVRSRMGEARYRTSRFELAAKILDEVVTAPDLVEYLTLAASRHLD